MWRPASHLVQNRTMGRDYATQSIASYKHTPNMESSDTNNKLFINDSQSTDLDSKITEWLANEEASLDIFTKSLFDKQQDIAIQVKHIHEDKPVIHFLAFSYNITMI